MVNVPAARAYGFRMDLNASVMRGVLHSPEVVQLLGKIAMEAEAAVESHVRATISSAHAENYVESLIVEDTFSDRLGMDFGGPYGLGNRPVVTVGIPAGRGPNPAAMPPLMVEAKTHALSSVAGFTVGKRGENIR